MVTLAGSVVQEQPVSAAAGGKQSPPVEVLASAVDQLNKHAQAVQRSLEFSIDDNSGRTVIQVIDTETEEVIRQIPSEDMLVLIRNINESVGNIFDDVV